MAIYLSYISINRHGYGLRNILPKEPVEFIGRSRDDIKKELRVMKEHRQETVKEKRQAKETKAGRLFKREEKYA